MQPAGERPPVPATTGVVRCPLMGAGLLPPLLLLPLGAYYSDAGETTPCVCSIPVSTKQVGSRASGVFFLLWLLFDLCVVHLLCPQYSAGELFGCAVPAVVAVPTSGDLAPEDGGVPQLTAVALGGSVTEKGAVAHSCLWNTQSVVESPFVVPPLHGIPLAAGAHGDDLPVFYARMFPGAIFHPPRHS